MWWIYALLSAVFAALTAILAKIGVSGINSNLATAIRTTVILFITWGIVFATRIKIDIKAIPQRTLIFLVLSALATGASWLFYFRALQIGQASKVAPIDKLSLVFTIVLAALVLGEKVNLMTIFGAALMTAGALVITFAK